MDGEYMKLIGTMKRTVGSILVLQTGAISKNTEITLNSIPTRGRSRGRVQGVHTPPEMMTILQHCINTVQSASQLYKIYCIVCHVFSAVHIFAFKICLRHRFLVVHPLLRKILDPPLHTTKYKRTNNGFCNTKKHPKCL